MGTRWGLLKHYWVVTKLVLTLGVITTAVQLDGRFAAQVMNAPASPMLLLFIGCGACAHAGQRDRPLGVQAVGQDMVRAAPGGR
jgi:hypothetical protein